MSREVRRRVFLAVGIPIGGMVFVAVMLWAFSRVLLAVDKDIAPVVALLLALNILVGSALAAIVRGRRSFGLVVAMMIVVVLGAGIAAAFVGEQELHRLPSAGPEDHAAPPAGPEDQGPEGAPTPTPGEGEEDAEQGGEETEEGGAEAAGEPVSVAADDLAFDTQTLELPAEEQVTIAFDNRDAAPHNVAIYDSEGGEPIFQGEIIDGGTQIDYTFESPAPGEYYFQCDVHPTMNGDVVVG